VAGVWEGLGGSGRIWRWSGENDPGSGLAPTGTGRASMLGNTRVQCCNETQQALSNAVGMGAAGEPPRRIRCWAAAPGCFIDDAERVKCVDGKAHSTFWYPAGNPTAQARRAVTSPRSAPADQGRQWSASACVGPAKLHNGRAPSTRVVSSPRNSDWRACRAVQSGPWRLHCQGPSCG